MYEQNSDIITPADDTVLWRYINLEKLLALINSKTLYLSRLDKFSDPWEGVWPQYMVDTIWQHSPMKTAETFHKSLDSLRGTMFVNCWHGSTYESAALWDQYARSAGIAIKTTVGTLKASLKNASNFFLGQVQYIEYTNTPIDTHNINALSPAFMKRLSFEHEREIRVLVWDSSFANQADQLSGTTHKNLEVDLNVLFEAIVVSPTAPSWLQPHISELITKFDLQGVPVIRSTLYDPIIR